MLPFGFLRTSLQARTRHCLVTARPFSAGSATAYKERQPSFRISATTRVGGNVAQKHDMTAAGLAGRIASYLLPTGYPSSVAPSYTPYAAYSCAGVVVSTAGGVLATQCMLFSVGLGAGALPLAAGINWVLKDGLGQLGGVLCAALINTRFDADPKRWRFVSALLLDSASALEIATAFYPAAFLPVAALANVLKNVAWLSSSATRAGLHQALSRGGNLADVTAKAGSQTIGAATLGTALGVALSASLGTGIDAVPYIGCAFLCLSATNLVLVKASLQAAVVPSLSPHRLWLACKDALNTPHVGVLPAAVASPASVAAQERFLPHQHDALHAAGLRILVNEQVHLTQDMNKYALACGTLSGTCRYIVSVHSSGSVGLLYCEDAEWRDLLLGYIHALRVALLMQKGNQCTIVVDAQASLAAVEASKQWVDEHGKSLVLELEQRGWWVGTPLVEPDTSRRVRIERE